MARLYNVSEPTISRILPHWLSWQGGLVWTKLTAVEIEVELAFEPRLAARYDVRISG